MNPVPDGKFRIRISGSQEILLVHDDHLEKVNNTFTQKQNRKLMWICNKTFIFNNTYHIFVHDTAFPSICSKFENEFKFQKGYWYFFLNQYQH